MAESSCFTAAACFMVSHPAEITELITTRGIQRAIFVLRIKILSAIISFDPRPIIPYANVVPIAFREMRISELAPVFNQRIKISLELHG